MYAVARQILVHLYLENEGAYEDFSGDYENVHATRMKYLGNQLNMPQTVARAWMLWLRNNGFVKLLYLYNEDEYSVCGSGYVLTGKGIDAAKEEMARHKRG